MKLLLLAIACSVTSSQRWEGTNTGENGCGVDERGVLRQPGDSWQEDCNRCHCLTAGIPGCTKMLCGDFPSLRSCNCPDTRSPVCGVDQKTYSNNCQAGCKGVEVECDGECICIDRGYVRPDRGQSMLAGASPQPRRMPDKVMGMYLPLADDTVSGYHTNNGNWEPLLYPYQQTGANVLFFSFINPGTMAVPESYKKLAATRGRNTDGAVPEDTLIIFAIGGEGYSKDPNPWQWLTSRQKAEEMAVQVAGWRDEYGIDGIDLDLETGAGSTNIAGQNMVWFIQRLKSLQPDMLVTQPTFGYPDPSTIQAVLDVINASWNPDGTSKNMVDSVGVMWYVGIESLNYVKNYAEATSQWQGFPIKVDVPRNQIMVGCLGSASSKTISTLAQESVKQDLLGLMVWFCSVRNGLVYNRSSDCSGSRDSMDGYVDALQYLSTGN